jgi:hypothetical protein
MLLNSSMNILSITNYVHICITNKTMSTLKFKFYPYNDGIGPYIGEESL